MPRTFQNPLTPGGADPCLFTYKGWYYFSWTRGNGVWIRKARRMEDLKSAADVQVVKPDSPERSTMIWAPEFHLIEGPNGKRWYCYYTAANEKSVDDSHRMYVAESASDDPMGPYQFKARVLTDPKDEIYAIDGGPIVLPDGKLYFTWCGRPSSAGQGIYISRMSDPWTTTGNRAYLDLNGHGCRVVREGPNAIVRNGKVFLLYSVCSANEPGYKLAMVTADVGADLLNLASWQSHPLPVIARVDQNGVYGPGHSFFFKSLDGKEDWIIYHVKQTTETTYADRVAFAMKFTWSKEGTPVFSITPSKETLIRAPSGER